MPFHEPRFDVKNLRCAFLLCFEIGISFTTAFYLLHHLHFVLERAYLRLVVNVPAEQHALLQILKRGQEFGDVSLSHMTEYGDIRRAFLRILLLKPNSDLMANKQAVSENFSMVRYNFSRTFALQFRLAIFGFFCYPIVLFLMRRRFTWL